MKKVLFRLLMAVVSLWLVATITFGLMHLIPGGPFRRERAVPVVIEASLEARYRLDQPLAVQYQDYLCYLLQGDLGPSFRYRGRTVNDIIASTFPVSAKLGLIALVIVLLTGIPAGVIAAVYHRQWPDHLVMLTSTTAMAVPGFILGTVLLYFFAFRWRILPPALWGAPEHIIMPAIALASLPAASIARLTRANLIETFGQDYILTARAKGLPPNRIIFIHGLKNALIPIITYLGPLVAMLLTGSFVIENIFAIPGLGRHFVTSIYNRDYTVIAGVTVFYSLILIVFNLLADCIYTLVDPRIRFRQREPV